MHRREWFARAAELALGLLLAVTAALKVSGLGAGTLAGDGWYARADVQAAAVAWEGLLAAGLFWGGARHLVWLLAVVTFAGFTGVNMSMGLAGQATCNCFGAVTVNPWWVFALDLVVLGLLAATRPSLAGFRRPLSVLAEIRPLAGYAAAAVLLSAGLTGAGWAAYGSPAAAIARLRGQVGGVPGGLIELGDHPGGTVLTPSVEVINHTAEPLTLTGGTANCSCVTWQERPVTIPPHGLGTITLSVRLPRSAGRFQQQAVFYADCGGRLHELPFGIVARVTAPCRRLSHPPARGRRADGPIGFRSEPDSGGRRMSKLFLVVSRVFGGGAVVTAALGVLLVTPASAHAEVKICPVPAYCSPLACTYNPLFTGTCTYSAGPPASCDCLWP